MLCRPTSSGSDDSVIFPLIDARVPATLTDRQSNFTLNVTVVAAGVAEPSPSTSWFAKLAGPENDISPLAASEGECWRALKLIVVPPNWNVPFAETPLFCANSGTQTTIAKRERRVSFMATSLTGLDWGR